MAQALGRLLRDRREPVAAIASRHAAHARAAAEFIGGIEPVAYRDLPRRATALLIAVPDDALPPLAELLADAGMRHGEAVHTCGTRGPEALAPLAARGVSCAAMHPLQTVATPQQGLANLPGAAFLITGEGPARAWAERMVRLLEGRPLSIPDAARPLYHAAAVAASNYVTALLDASVDLLEAAGIERREALAALGPLVRASVENTLTLGPAAALTGPVERGDAATVALHWRAMAGLPPTVRELYRAAGRHALAIARRKGLDSQIALELESIWRDNRNQDA